MNNLALAKEKLSKCTSLLIGAGAGIGKDSGLPDFRGNEGFWNNYPPYRNKFNFY
jgi:NAD-dependent SIR2 family protein deacetylase